MMIRQFGSRMKHPSCRGSRRKVLRVALVFVQATGLPISMVFPFFPEREDAGSGQSARASECVFEFSEEAAH